MLDSELAREKMWSRIHLIPLLTAEEDRDLVRRHYADLAREKELLGTTTAVYNSDRYGTREDDSLIIADNLRDFQICTANVCCYSGAGFEIGAKETWKPMGQGYVNISIDYFNSYPILDKDLRLKKLSAGAIHLNIRNRYHYQQSPFPQVKI